MVEIKKVIEKEVFTCKWKECGRFMIIFKKK